MKEFVVTTVFKIAEWDELTRDVQELFRVAIKARKSARALFSHFQVGAAMRTESGLVFAGCNMEDIAHTMTIHAEQGALAAMGPLAPEGDRISEVAIALGMESVTIDFPPRRTGPNIERTSEIVYTPCGHCRSLYGQKEYLPSGRPAMVYALQPNGQILITNLNDLYPLGFAT